MTNPSPINPELVLKAAQMAIPNTDEDQWDIDINGLVFRVTLVAPYYVLFNPLTSDADAWALERALKKEGRVFHQEGTHYMARTQEKRSDCRNKIALSDPSDTLLLLKCVAAMNSIDLYVSGGGCE